MMVGCFATPHLTISSFFFLKLPIKKRLIMTFTVEKIGGTSMTAFDAVLDNIILRPKT
ncbi:aspartate kinase, partial [Vibrio sp. Vb0587]|nr:aspartate kinase [Vibrio sp. Vb0587]